MAASPNSPARLRLISATFTQERRGASLGHAQLSLVEHALCPLDASSLGQPLIYDTRYWYTDKNHHRKEARARIACPDGLSPTDEFYLWGLLSLTFSQPAPSPDFYATPYYCLRQLGCIAPRDPHGGRNYALFRASIGRLATVSYRNDHFYDPVRGEPRQVGFGFLSYSLPVDPASSRAWRFAWDPTDSWQRKIRLYNILQDRNYPDRFRVLVVTTRCSGRLQSILALAAQHATNPHRSLIYGVHLPAYLADANAVSSPCFRNHRDESVTLLPSAVLPAVVPVATPPLDAHASPV